jgi:hypothetical protein
MHFKSLVLLTVLVLMQQSCIDFVDRGPRYDLHKILVGQRSVYFKREIRGRNYKGLSISSDGTLCNGPSARTDFFVDSETIGKVFYKVEGDELKIYSQSVFTPPETGTFQVKIVQSEIPPAKTTKKESKNLVILS